MENKDFIRITLCSSHNQLWNNAAALMRTERQGACVHLRTCAAFVCGSVCLCCDTEMKAKGIRRGEGLRHSRSDPPRRSQKVFKSENSAVTPTFRRRIKSLSFQTVTWVLLSLIFQVPSKITSLIIANVCSEGRCEWHPSVGKVSQNKNVKTKIKNA